MTRKGCSSEEKGGGKGGKLGKGPHIRVCTLSILDSIKIIVLFEITQILPKVKDQFDFLCITFTFNAFDDVNFDNDRQSNFAQECDAYIGTETSNGGQA